MHFSSFGLKLVVRGTDTYRKRVPAEIQALQRKKSVSVKLVKEILNAKIAELFSGFEICWFRRRKHLSDNYSKY